MEALRIRAFRNLWLGQAISQFGDAFYYVVFFFMVKKITGSTEMVGIVGAAETLPYFLFGGYAGVLADRLDRKQIMLASDFTCAGILFLFGVLVATMNPVPGWTLAATPFLVSCARVFFMPAKSAAIPALVPEALLMKANALSSMTQSFMPILGLALSASVLGLLYSISKSGFFLAAILVNGLSFLGSALYIRTLPPVVVQRVDEVKHPWREFLQGLGYLKGHRTLFVYLFVSAAMNLMISPFFVVYVETNNRWFGGTPQILCLFELTFFVGLVVASGIVGKLNLRRVGQSYVISLTIVGLSVAGMAYCRSVVAYCALNIACGLAVPFCDIPLTTYLQLEVEDAFRGRVNSVLTMVRTGTMPIGMVLGGALVSGFGLVGAYLVMGLGMAVTALAGLASADFRNAKLRGPSSQAAVEWEADLVRG